jgi:hypothetical protein
VSFTAQRDAFARVPARVVTNHQNYEDFMPGKRGLPRCTAITTKGQRCRASAVRDGKCECHHPDTAAAFHQRNREATRAYWRTRRMLEEFAATASA